MLARLRFAVLGLLLLVPELSLAHAQLRASTPAAGSVIAHPPEAVTLDFNEPVAPVVLRWIAPGGGESQVAGTAANARVTVIPPDGLGEGTHLLSWRVVSADGHPVGGTLSFSIGTPSATQAAPADRAGGAAWAVVAARFFLTLALVAAVGMAAFSAVVTRAPPTRSMRRTAIAAALLALPSSLALIAAQGFDLLSLPPAALLTAAPWQAARTAPLVVTTALSVLAVLLAVLALVEPAARRRAHRPLAFAAWGVAALSFAASGHAATAEPRWIAAPAVALHALALVFWTGTLVPLLSAFRRPGGEAVLARFASLALPLVMLLVASGALLTAIQAGSVASLAGSAYGQVLTVKLALVAGMLALALRNRLRLVPRLAAGEPSAGPALSRAIRAEIALGLVVLALAAGFRLTPPPRALVATVPPLQVHVHADYAMADLRLAPGRAGPVDVALAVHTGGFQPLVPLEAEMAFAMPGRGIEPIRIRLRAGDDGLWHGSTDLPVAGDWDVTIRLLVTEFERATLQATVTLAP
ncbi:CopD family protein [Polymorphum gilvum]|uniref:Copper resistance protein CopC n=1 Tax=Polymorphum gilvum (strain LMG 25793 / CGMCC 1.9160 / SL003B-26A1) TaxID=991905 RepID=F2J3G5_POLGS|nr:CopD family protein [Polymorphum gilvum]ADZ70990.1 Copper resistance protein CopC [Polymorphum gilvum SL003B-26A1]